MKNLHWALHGLWALLVAVLFYLTLSKPGTQAGAASTDSTATAAANIVFINTDSLTAQYQWYKDMYASFDSRKARVEADIRARSQQLEQEFATYQQTGGGMTDQQRAATEQRLVQKRDQIQQYIQQQNQAIADEERSKSEEFLRRLQTYLQKRNAGNNVQYVLGVSRGGGILYTNAANDITREVLKDLNAEYAAERKK